MYRSLEIGFGNVDSLLENSGCVGAPNKELLGGVLGDILLFNKQEESCLLK
jgi:hypothetical protein